MLVCVAEGFLKRTYAGLCAHGNGLRALPECVLDIDVVQFEVAGPDSKCASEVVAGLRLLALRGDDRDLVLGVGGVIGSVPKHCQGSAELGDVDLFLVGSRVDEDDLFAGDGGRQRGDGFGDFVVFLSFADHESA